MGGAKHEFLVLTLCDFIFPWTFESTYKRIWDFLFLLERCSWGHLRPKCTFLRLKETVAWKSQYLVKGKCLRYETRIMSLILIRKMTPYQQIRNVLFPSLVNTIFEQTNSNTFSEKSLSRMNLNHRGPQRKKSCIAFLCYHCHRTPYTCIFNWVFTLKLYLNFHLLFLFL